MIKPNADKQCCAKSSKNKVEKHCPVEATINLIGGKYKSLILWELTGKTLRFSELKKAVPYATPKMLTQQLRELEENGLIKRKVYPVVPPKVEYSLTSFGLSIRPVLESMYLWGRGYLQKQGVTPACSMIPPEETGRTAPDAVLPETTDYGRS